MELNHEFLPSGDVVDKKFFKRVEVIGIDGDKNRLRGFKGEARDIFKSSPVNCLRSIRIIPQCDIEIECRWCICIVREGPSQGAQLGSSSAGLEFSWNRV